ncbi:MAG: hypothetical protein Q9M41_03565, partial [Paracoccaceae bacterium]|nr:hypothetical protein [Paracoccaceae bacterium]
PEPEPEPEPENQPDSPGDAKQKEPSETQDTPATTSGDQPNDIAPAPETATSPDGADKDNDVSAPRPRPIDNKILEIIKREAEREEKLRQSEASEPETDDAEDPEAQPPAAEPQEKAPPADSVQDFLDKLNRNRELALGQETTHRDPRSAPKPTPSEPPPAPEPEPTSKSAASGGMPDFNAVKNQPLHADTPASDDLRGPDEYPVQDDARGGRLGFYLAILLFVALFALYAFRGQITEALPQIGPWLDIYASAVNKARLLLASGVNALLASVRDLLQSVL